jgi:ABC-type sugar transport system, periplasmic component
VYNGKCKGDKPVNYGATVRKNYTLKEIAKELNVSRATIDRVIHERGGIGDETVKKVRDFLDSIEYKPNKVGRCLAKRYDKNIYVIFHDSKNEFLQGIQCGVAAAEQEIRDFGFSVHILVVDENSEEQIRVMRKIADEGAEAIAVSPYEPDKFVDVIDEFVKKGIRVITLNNDVVDSTRLCYIGSNYYKSGRIAGEVMAKHMKYGKAAVLSCKSSYWQNQQRITGFREVIDRFPAIEMIGPFKTFTDFETSYCGLKDLIENISDLKGVFVLDNYEGIVAGVCKALSENAKPGIDVISLDLNSECVKGLLDGYITASVCQDPFSQGYWAVKLLFDYLFDNRQPKSSLYLTRLDVIYKENLDNYDHARNIMRL